MINDKSFNDHSDIDAISLVLYVTSRIYQNSPRKRDKSYKHIFNTLFSKYLIKF